MKKLTLIISLIVPISLLAVFITLADTQVVTINPDVTTIELTAIDSGWYSNAGTHGPTNTNYVAGECSLPQCSSPIIFRNFFVFDLSTITGQILNASLLIENPDGGYNSGNVDETWSVYDVNVPVSSLVTGGTGLVSTYNDLGSGFMYGSAVVNATTTLAQVPLNNSALDDLNDSIGSNFAVGGAITTLDGVNNSEWVFGDATEVHVRKLVLTVLPAPPNWQIEQVDTELGMNVSLALAPTFPYTAHVSYNAGTNGSYSLKHAVYQGNDWQKTTVDNVRVSGTSIALTPDSNHVPHIAYYTSYTSDPNNGDLKYAYWNGTSWIKTTVAMTVNPGWGLSLALAPASPYTPTIAYVDNNNILYTQWNGSDWTIDLVDAGTSNFFKMESPSLVLENQSPYHPHLSYHNTDTGDLKYAYWDGNQWVKTTIGQTGNTSEPTSLALDSSGNPHIGYREWRMLKYTHWNGSIWVNETLDDNVNWPVSLKLDKNDQPHMTFVDDPINLNHIYLTSSGWISETIDTVQVYGASFALDPNDQPFVAYDDTANLRFAWQTRSTSIPSSGGTFTPQPSVTLEFPENAVTDTVALSFTSLQPYGVQPNIGVFYDLNATYIIDGQPAQIASGQTYMIVVHYDDADIPAGINEIDLALYYLDGSDWIREPSSIVNTAANTLTATPNHFSVWAGLAFIDFKEQVFLPVVIR